jgi:hypothetical protein
MSTTLAVESNNHFPAAASIIGRISPVRTFWAGLQIGVRRKSLASRLGAGEIARCEWAPFARAGGCIDKCGQALRPTAGGIEADKAPLHLAGSANPLKFVQPTRPSEPLRASLPAFCTLGVHAT